MVLSLYHFFKGRMESLCFLAFKKKKKKEKTLKHFIPCLQFKRLR